MPDPAPAEVRHCPGCFCIQDHPATCSQPFMHEIGHNWQCHGCPGVKSAGQGALRRIVEVGNAAQEPKQS